MIINTFSHKLIFNSYKHNNLIKRSMFTMRKILPAISLIPKASPKIFSRHPSFVAEGTLLLEKEYQDIKKILYFNNQYLFNLRFSQDIDYQTFQFYKNVMLKNPKLFQHILSVAYPNAKYSLYDLKNAFPKINIDSGKADLFVTEDVIVAVTAAEIMKQNPMFKNGSLTVLACDDYLTNKKEQVNESALAQTKQLHPDYYYVYKPIDKNNGMWQRYYDFKTGKFNINTGHIFCISDKEQYEKKVAHHLYAQYEFYKEKEIKDVYKELINNKKLTWSERNIEIQNFFRDNLYKYPDINPSFILYNPLIYEIDQQDIPKKFTGFVISESLETVENTQTMLAKAITLGGKTCQENYIKHPYNSPIIVGFIKEYLKNKMQL